VSHARQITRGLAPIAGAEPPMDRHADAHGHWKLTSPIGGFIFTGGSPSDRRALRNMRALMRRLARQSIDSGGGPAP
jgi:hypothetical protein